MCVRMHVCMHMQHRPHLLRRAARGLGPTRTQLQLHLHRRELRRERRERRAAFRGVLARFEQLGLGGTAGVLALIVLHLQPLETLPAPPAGCLHLLDGDLLLPPERVARLQALRHRLALRLLLRQGLLALLEIAGTGVGQLAVAFALVERFDQRPAQAPVLVLRRR